MGGRLAPPGLLAVPSSRMSRYSSCSSSPAGPAAAAPPRTPRTPAGSPWRPVSCSEGANASATGPCPLLRTTCSPRSPAQTRQAVSVAMALASPPSRVNPHVVSLRQRHPAAPPRGGKLSAMPSSRPGSPERPVRLIWGEPCRRRAGGLGQNGTGDGVAAQVAIAGESDLGGHTQRPRPRHARPPAGCPLRRWTARPRDAPRAWPCPRQAQRVENRCRTP